jgi:hypothetical protein
MSGLRVSIIKRLGNPTTSLKYRFINGNLFMLSEWNNGMLEYWNIGDKGKNKPF